MKSYDTLFARVLKERVNKIPQTNASLYINRLRKGIPYFEKILEKTYQDSLKYTRSTQSQQTERKMNVQKRRDDLKKMKNMLDETHLKHRIDRYDRGFERLHASKHNPKTAKNMWNKAYDSLMMNLGDIEHALETTTMPARNKKIIAKNINNRKTWLRMSSLN